jgi:hypothetical protein
MDNDYETPSLTALFPSNMGIVRIRAHSDSATRFLLGEQSAVRQESSVQELLYFSINTVADMTAVPLSASE